MLLVGLLISVSVRRAFAVEEKTETETRNAKRPEPTLFRFLSVYVLFASADWAQGPYFHAVYAEKKIFSERTIAWIFTAGYAFAALSGLCAGRYADRFGRRKSCAVFAALFIFSALCTISNSFVCLVVGRACGGVASALLHTAPEAWFVTELRKEGTPRSTQCAFFGWQHFASSFSAVLAGEMTTIAVERHGVGGPFILSVMLVVVGSMAMFALWTENYGDGDDMRTQSSSSTFAVIRMIRSDKRLVLLGLIQSFFDAAVYIFVLVWSSTIRSSVVEDSVETVPLGRMFSGFMMSMMLGSSVHNLVAIFHDRSKHSALFIFTVLTSICFAMTTLDAVRSSVEILMLSYCVLEFTVGFFKPVLTSLRSNMLPSSHRSTIMNLYRVPLNLKVIAAYVSYSCGLITRNQIVYFGSAFFALASIGLVALSRNEADSNQKRKAE